MKKLIGIIGACAFSIAVMAGGGEKGKAANYCAEMKNGKLIIKHDGAEVKADVRLSNGTWVKTDGTVIAKDGTRTVLKSGQCVDLDGKVMDTNKDMPNDPNNPNKKDLPNNKPDSTNNNKKFPDKDYPNYPPTDTTKKTYPGKDTLPK